MSTTSMKRLSHRKVLLIAGLFLFSFTPALWAGIYNVGPGQAYSAISELPLASIQAGDTILIHWRAEPYREKWAITAQGTAQSPVIFRGVPNGDGDLPVIDGENATTNTELSFWNEDRCIIKIGGSSSPPDQMPQHIIIENLVIRGARPPATFLDDRGIQQTYSTNASAIFIAPGENITIRNCEIRDCCNGLFVASSGSSVSRDILIEGNDIHSNGLTGNIYVHNTYTAAIGMTYQYNRFGPLASGARGNALKDRSAGLVVRYNWIEGGNRQLDLVDAEDSSLIVTDPDYDKTFVYGNTLIKKDDNQNPQFIHYGGDSGNTSIYRKGRLYLYHNTFINEQIDDVTIVRLSTVEEHCDARNNIFFTVAPNLGWNILDENGVINLTSNWITPIWQEAGTAGDYTVTASNWTDTDIDDIPFANVPTQDFTLAENSLCLDFGSDLHPDVLPDHAVTSQYVRHQAGEPRDVLWHYPDLGAFESPHRLLYDYNRDGEINLEDYETFADCMAGPGVLPPTNQEECLYTFDVDADNDVDLQDFYLFQINFD